MKSHVLLIGCVLEDLGTRCCTSTSRDLKTITRRVENEGLSFLTITLPTFAKNIERCLELGKVDSSLFKAFALKGPYLPAFLRGFTSQVFDEYTGELLSEPSVDAIYAIRQVSYLFKKLQLPCTVERENAAFDQFIECDNQVREHDKRLRHSDILRDFNHASLVLFAGILSVMNQQAYDGSFLPNHGPGATADRLRANGKWENRMWTTRLEEAGLSASEYLYPSPKYFISDVLDGKGPIWLEPESEIPVRVISVPKTLKTPRIIAIEPAHTQYVQQGIKDSLMKAIEGDDILSTVIGFRDQEANHVLAKQGSMDGSYATLDLSEASDRVSNLLVRNLFGRHDYLLKAVMSSRSYRADVPGHGIHYLSKFASMGSALTFPVEAMVFTTAVFMGIARELNSQLTPAIVKRYRRSVRVYGDDIIVPVRFVRSVVDSLEALGLVVNHDKSFWTGKFRESCGGDFYDGFDVNPVKVVHELPTSRKQATEIGSAVALRNLMYTSGNWRTAAFLDEWLKRFIPLPVVLPSSPGLGRHSHLGYESKRLCPTLHRDLVKAAVLVPIIPSSRLDGPGALLKCELGEFNDSTNKRHLKQAGRPEVVNIKLRWVPPY